MMIEIFKTNVQSSKEADQVIAVLHESYPACTANFDLTDCDRILRVMAPGAGIDVQKVISSLALSGFIAEVLSDETDLFQIDFSLGEPISPNSGS